MRLETKNTALEIPADAVCAFSVMRSRYRIKVYHIIWWANPQLEISTTCILVSADMYATMHEPNTHAEWRGKGVGKKDKKRSWVTLAMMHAKHHHGVSTCAPAENRDPLAVPIHGIPFTCPSFSSQMSAHNLPQMRVLSLSSFANLLMS